MPRRPHLSSVTAPVDLKLVRPALGRAGCEQLGQGGAWVGLDKKQQEITRLKFGERGGDGGGLLWMGRNASVGDRCRLQGATQHRDDLSDLSAARVFRHRLEEPSIGIAGQQPLDQATDLGVCSIPGLAGHHQAPAGG